MQDMDTVQHLLPLRAVKALTSLSHTSVYRLMKTGEFPQSVRVSTNRVAWRESDIKLWIEARQPN